MSAAVSLKIPVIFCLVGTALANARVGGVQWRKSGDSITIQCRTSTYHASLELTLGLNQEFHVFHRDGESAKEIIAKEFAGRLQTNNKFPNPDILIKNLSPNDTGPYWCTYKKYNELDNEPVVTKGEGSVLLVVKEDKQGGKDDVQPECGHSNQDVILVCVVIIGAMLLLIITGFLVWIIHKNRSGRTPKKPRHVPANDVYEDMRATRGN